jgi:hypothetical protein
MALAMPTHFLFLKFMQLLDDEPAGFSTDFGNDFRWRGYFPVSPSVVTALHQKSFVV